MNKRIKVLVSAVLATVMLVLCIPFTAAAAGTTVSVTLADKGWTNSTQYTTLEMDSVVTVTVAGGSNTGKYYDSGTAWRLYASENATMTIAAEGKTIDGVKITYTSYKTGILSLNGNEVESDEVVTVNASTITFDVLDTDTSDGNGQARIEKIEVYYDYNGSIPSCTHAYTNEYDAKCDNCGESRAVTLPADGSTLDYATATKIGAAQEHNTYTANEYVLTGVVKTIGNTTYGNITIEDSTGATFYLRTVKDTAGNNYGYFTDTKPVVGDTVTVKGKLGRYNSTIQMEPAVVTSVVPSTTPCTHAYTNDYDATCNNCGESRTVTLPAADSTLTFDVANKLGAAQDAETADKYYVIGKVTAIGNTTYGNMTIEDEDGNTLEIYGTYSADGATRYDSMTTKPAVGDTVKLYGVMGQYNGTAQMESAWTIEITPAGSGSQGGGNQGAGSPNTSDNVVAYIAVAVVALFGIAYVSKKH